MKLSKVVQVVALVGISIFLSSALAITIDGFRDRISESDVAIVFGSKVNPDGTLSTRLAARLNKSIELYRQNMFSHIIVSGGTGKEGVDEAVAMKTYLLAHQIPAAAIFTDNHGNNTEATAKNSLSLMRAHGFKSALIISQYFHISRAHLALKQCGISPLYTAHANYFEWRDMYSLAREVIGYYDYLLTYPTCASR